MTVFPSRLSQSEDNYCQLGYHSRSRIVSETIIFTPLLHPPSITSPHLPPPLPLRIQSKPPPPPQKKTPPKKQKFSMNQRTLSHTSRASIHSPSTHSRSTLVSMCAVFNPTQHNDNSNNPRKSTLPQCNCKKHPKLYRCLCKCNLSHRAHLLPSALPCNSSNHIKSQ